MTRRKAKLTIASAVLALCGLYGPASAFDGNTGASGADRGAIGRAIAQDDRRPGAYGDIMDDVDAIIGAMEESSPRSGAANGADAPPVAARNASAPALQGPRTPSPIVIELFTAQGCDACPSVEAMLADLVGRRDVLVLSWHVDYWDYLGWADSFARPEFSARQKGYNLSRGARSLFTPQVIVAGETAIDAPSPAGLMAAIKHERAEGDHVAISRRADGPRSEIELTPLQPLPTDIAVQMIRYLPTRSVEVTSGENSGRKLQLNNVVVSRDMLDFWDGRAPLRMVVTLGAGAAADLPADTRHALIVQEMHGPFPGEIFATILLD